MGEVGEKLTSPQVSRMGGKSLENTSPAGVVPLGPWNTASSRHCQMSGRVSLDLQHPSELIYGTLHTSTTLQRAGESKSYNPAFPSSTQKGPMSVEVLPRGRIFYAAQI